MIMALMLGLAVVACSPKAEEVIDENTAEELPAPKTAKDYKSSKAEIDDVSYLIGVNFGSFIKNYNFGSDLNYAQIRKGMDDFVNAKGNMRSPEFGEQFRVNPNTMNEVFNEYLEKRHNYTLHTNLEAGEKFLAANAKKSGVRTSPSGLQYKIISEGNELRATLADTVYVNYRGTLLDKTVFDETPEGAEPVKLNLTRVIKGWQEGLQLVGEGGELELYIPSDLAYGKQGTQGIEPGSTLIFNVSLAKIGKKAE